MFGRIAARILLAALRSPHVQAAAVEVSRFAARRATAFLLRKLRSSSTFNDNSGGRHISAGAMP